MIMSFLIRNSFNLNRFLTQNGPDRPNSIYCVPETLVQSSAGMANLEEARAGARLPRVN